MVGFPTAWDDGAGDQTLPVWECPYSNVEIERYLVACHNDLVLSEKSQTFAVNPSVLARREVGRNYWVCSAEDGLDREWLIIVGSGQSPFDPSKRVWRWMYARTNDLGQTPAEFLRDEYGEKILHDTKEPA